MDNDKEIIWFYDETGEKSKKENMFLNNFELSDFYADDNFKYISAEHYYQAHKFKGYEHPEFEKYFLEVRSAESPLKSKKLARAYQKEPKFNNELWDKNKDIVMKKALIYKFSQNKNLLDRLINTGTAELREESKRDKYWGGLLEDSQNKLGFMLAELRENYKKEGKVFLEGSGLEKVDSK